MGKIQSMLTLDGESDYRRQLSLINANLKTLEKELSATSSQFTIGSQKIKQTADISANYGKQMEFLTQKQDVLKRAMANAEKEIENNSKKLTNARQAYDLSSKAIESTKKEIEYLTLKYGANSSAVQNAKERLTMYEEAQKRASKEISAAETAVSRAGKAYHTYRQQLADTQTQINKTEAAQRKLNDTEEKTAKSSVDLAKTIGEVSSGFGTAIGIAEKFYGVIGKVGGVSLQAFKTSVNAVNTEIDLGLKGLEAYGAAVTAAGTAVGGFALSNGTSFEASMSKVKAYANLDPVKDAEAIRALTEAAKETGASTTKTATEAADALGFLALNGWKTEQMLSALLPVTKASEAGGVDLATVANLTARSLTAYGRGAEEAEDFLNILTATQNNSSNSLYDLLTVYTDTAGTFKELGVDFKESAALIGVFANQGVSGAEAATALNSVMLRLLGTNKKAKTALTDIGVSAWNEDGTFKGLTQTLREAGDALANMTQEERINAEAAISGVLRFQDFQKLINGVMDTEGYQNVWDPINNAIENQTLYNTAATMMENLQGKFELFKSASSALGTSIYETFATEATGGLLKATHWVDVLNDGVKKTAENYEKLDQMQAQFDKGDYYGGFLAASDIMSPELAATLRREEGLPALMEELYSRADEPILRSIRAVTARASTELTNGIDKTAKLLPGKLNIFNTVIDKGAGLLIQGLSESKDKLLPELIEGATQLALDLTDYLPQLTEDVADGAEILFTGILNGLDRVADKLIDEGKLDSMIDTVNKFFDENGEELWSSGLSIIEKIGKGIYNHRDQLIGTGAKVISKIADDITKNAPKLIDNADKMIEKIVEGLEKEETLEKLTDAAVTVTDSLVEKFDLNVERFDRVVEIIGNRLKSEENIDKLMNIGMNLGAAVIDGILDVFKRHTLLGRILFGTADLTQWAAGEIQNDFGIGAADVAPAGTSVMANRPQSSIRERNTGDNVTFNITGNNINDYNDIERLVEQGAVLYNNAMRAGGKR